MIESAGQALAFAEGREDHVCVVHVPDEIDVKAIREKISLSQGEFARLFGLSKHAGTLGACQASAHRSGTRISHRDLP
jgi:putative transcriptional regulator